MTEQKAHLPAFLARLRGLAKAPASRRWGKRLAIFIVVFGLLGYFAAPPLLKSILLKQLSAELHREVSIERVDVNPYALSVRLTGVSVRGEGGKEVFGFDELFANASLASLFQFGAVVDEIRLQGPRVAVARVAEGRYDISDLLDEWMKPKEPSPTPRFSLNNISVSAGRIVFDDQPVGRQHTVTDINLTLPFVSSMGYYADVWVQPGFSATIDGASLNLQGRSRPFASTHESVLDLNIDNFDLTGLQPYLPAGFPLRIEAATVDGKLEVVFRELADKVPSLALCGNVELAGLKVVEADGRPLVGWKKLGVELTEVDPVNRHFTIGQVSLDGLEASLAVDRQGQLNALRVLERLQGKPQPAAPATPAAAALVWSLGGFALNDGLLHWADESGARPVKGEVRDLRLKVGKVDGKLVEPVLVEEFATRLDFGDRLQGGVQLKDLKVDLAGQQVDVGEIASNGMRLKMARGKDGAIDWLTPPQLKAAKAASRPEASGQRPWQANIGKVAVGDLAVRFEDTSNASPAVQVIDKLTLTAEGLSTRPGQAGKLDLAARINDKGSLKVGGSLQLTPLKAQLQVDSMAVPLLPLQPYFTEYLNIALTRGQVSSSGEVSAETGSNGLAAGYKGSVTLGDLLTVDKVNNADLLRWKSLHLGGIDFRLDPLSLNIGEIALADFYSRLIIGPSGKLNLAELVRQPAAPAAPAAPSGTEKAPETPADAAGKAPGKAPPPITIGKITVQGGTLNFSDFFVKPNYTVNVTKVGGRISKLSSTSATPADMELRGTYANSAPVNIVAKLNPLAARAYLDLKADVSNVDLVPFSPYSGKYAGYNIEKGKLTLNVAYKLENGQLNAENRLFLDQLTFGEKVDSPTATSLPVNLAISLLKNNRGEIDLNLPISGSLDDPQFSVGGLVIKVIVNLFVKAVTSPFALLGSMFGSGEELSSVDFAPGYAAFSEATQKKLETLAKALREREKLEIEITGRADPDIDLEGLKRAAVSRAVRAEKRKELTSKSKESGSLDSIEVGDSEYADYLRKAYRDAKFPKPRNLVGMQKELPVEEMEKLMLTNQPATPDDVRQLAMRRAEVVQVWLIEQGKVPPERIFLSPPKVGADAKAQATRVDFSLK